MSDQRTTPRDGAPATGGGGPRILVVEPRLTEDGGARSTLRLVQQWRRAGVPVLLHVLQRPRPGDAATLPPDVEPFYATRSDRRLRQVLVPALLRLVGQARQADVVVSGRDVGWGLLLARVASLVARRPFVVMIRSAPGLAIERWVRPRLRGVTRWSYRSADRVVCISPGLVPAALELGVRPERVSVVLNGVEVDRILSEGRAPAADLPPGEGPLVVGIGRLEGQKGFDVLLRAHARVVAAGHPHRVLVLGEGPDRAGLEALAAELGVAGSVHLPGFTAQPLPVLAAADLFALPSRWEGFGQSLAEALLLGTPVVAADCVAGPRLLLADGAHGDLLPVGDVEALASAMERHFADPRRLRAAAARGSAWARAHLSIERSAAELLEVLREVPADRRRGRRPASPR